MIKHDVILHDFRFAEPTSTCFLHPCQVFQLGLLTRWRSRNGLMTWNPELRVLLWVTNHVYFCDFPFGISWIPHKVESVCGPLTYWVELTDGWSVRRLVGHILPHSTTDSESEPAPTPTCLDLPYLPTTSPNLLPESTPTSVPLQRSSRISNLPNCYDSPRG